jgi:hypothetical protein
MGQGCLHRPKCSDNRKDATETDLENHAQVERSLPIIPAPKITDDGVTSYVSARPISCSTDYSSANFKTNRSKQIGKNQSLSDALADSSAKNKVF